MRTEAGSRSHAGFSFRDGVAGHGRQVLSLGARRSVGVFRFLIATYGRQVLTPSQGRGSGLRDTARALCQARKRDGDKLLRTELAKGKTPPYALAAVRAKSRGQSRA